MYTLSEKIKFFVDLALRVTYLLDEEIKTDCIKSVGKFEKELQKMSDNGELLFHFTFYEYVLYVKENVVAHSLIIIKLQDENSSDHTYCIFQSYKNKYTMKDFVEKYDYIINEKDFMNITNLFEKIESFKEFVDIETQKKYFKYYFDDVFKPDFYRFDKICVNTFENT